LAIARITSFFLPSGPAQRLFQEPAAKSKFMRVSLAWTEDCGVPANLLRVSVGLEPVETVIQAFKDALD